MKSSYALTSFILDKYIEIILLQIHVVERNVICMPDVKTINVFAVWEHTDQEKLVNVCNDFE